jgi:hypothetical protein
VKVSYKEVKYVEGELFYAGNMEKKRKDENL